MAKILSFQDRIIRIVEGQEVLVGRSSSRTHQLPAIDNLIFDNPVISRDHARISMHKGDLFVADEDSTHGTQYNVLGGLPWTLTPEQPHVLRDKGILTFGADVLKGKEVHSRVSGTVRITDAPPSPPQAAGKDLQSAGSWFSTTLIEDDSEQEDDASTPGFELPVESISNPQGITIEIQDDMGSSDQGDAPLVHSESSRIEKQDDFRVEDSMNAHISFAMMPDRDLTIESQGTIEQEELLQDEIEGRQTGLCGQGPNCNQAESGDSGNTPPDIEVQLLIDLDHGTTSVVQPAANPIVQSVLVTEIECSSSDEAAPSEYDFGQACQNYGVQDPCGSLDSSPGFLASLNAVINPQTENFGLPLERAKEQTNCSPAFEEDEELVNGSAKEAEVDQDDVDDEILFGLASYSSADDEDYEYSELEDIVSEYSEHTEDSDGEETVEFGNDWKSLGQNWKTLAISQAQQGTDMQEFAKCYSNSIRKEIKQLKAAVSNLQGNVTKLNTSNRDSKTLLQTADARIIAMHSELVAGFTKQCRDSTKQREDIAEILARCQALEFSHAATHELKALLLKCIDKIDEMVEGSIEMTERFDDMGDDLCDRITQNIREHTDELDETINDMWQDIGSRTDEIEQVSTDQLGPIAKDLIAEKFDTPDPHGFNETSTTKVTGQEKAVPADSRKKRSSPDSGFDVVAPEPKHASRTPVWSHTIKNTAAGALLGVGLTFGSLAMLGAST